MFLRMFRAVFAVGGGAVPSKRHEFTAHLAGARFALRGWLCSASADVVMRRVYRAALKNE